jgi:hypothetical protein
MRTSCEIRTPHQVPNCCSKLKLHPEMRTPLSWIWDTFNSFQRCPYITGFTVSLFKQLWSSSPQRWKRKQWLVSNTVCFVTSQREFIHSNSYIFHFGRNKMPGYKTQKVIFFFTPTHTPEHIVAGWSRYTDTSEPVVGYGPNNITSILA